MSDIYSPKLQNSVFKCLAKSKVTTHGDLWYDGKAVTPRCETRRDGREKLQERPPFPFGGLQLVKPFDLTHRDQDFFDIIDLGFRRILTNGRKNRASEGIPLIKKLVVQAANKVIIMPGPSISHLNVGNILHETKVVEVQSSGENPQSNTISEPYSIHILVVSPTVLGEEVKKIKATLNRYPLLYY
ncbi:hypothetical protein TNCV_513771 [Trichonephila clavipes]|nr:hypothetical protein TNCV_513771 [Trichonephila clavipes]